MPDLIRAALNCPHTITDKRVILEFAPDKSGHNALNQLGRRLDAELGQCCEKAGGPGQVCADCAKASAAFSADMAPVRAAAPAAQSPAEGDEVLRLARVAVAESEGALMVCDWMEAALKVCRAVIAHPQPKYTAEAVAPWQLERMRHIANEWADMATNGPQYLRNVRDGICTIDEALAGLAKDYEHCRKVNDAPGLYGSADIPAPAPAHELPAPDPAQEREVIEAAFRECWSADTYNPLGETLQKAVWLGFVQGFQKARATQAPAVGAEETKIAGWGCHKAAEWVAGNGGPGRCEKHCGDEQRCITSAVSPVHHDGLTDEQIDDGYRRYALRTTAVVVGGRKSFLAGVEFARAALAARRQQEPAHQDAALPRLIAHHAALLETNSYAYFELAYTRSTGWMAWITDKPAKGEPGTAEYARSRKVIARGQGDTPEEAAADALAAMGESHVPVQSQGGANG